MWGASIGWDWICGFTSERLLFERFRFVYWMYFCLSRFMAMRVEDEFTRWCESFPNSYWLTCETELSCKVFLGWMSSAVSMVFLNEKGWYAFLWLAGFCPNCISEFLPCKIYWFYCVEFLRYCGSSLTLGVISSLPTEFLTLVSFFIDFLDLLMLLFEDLDTSIIFIFKTFFSLDLKLFLMLQQSREEAWLLLPLECPCDESREFKEIRWWVRAFECWFSPLTDITGVSEFLNL